ncbi:hypothetical protein APX70_02307 [Pseudomonas syringae pv. maculicola]|uniref:Uncharacterized protein n=1 Tax=Pseudomonas syringae pv. maculicola TaxID=59511 RepID=A0A3M2XDP8_PSEYM|nr:hypothetical protein APX70_02307 [Pseudomonas syringae pv. maculicola]
MVVEVNPGFQQTRYRLLETDRVHLLRAGQLYSLSEDRLLRDNLPGKQQAEKIAVHQGVLPLQDGGGFGGACLPGADAVAQTSSVLGFSHSLNKGVIQLFQ